MSLYGALCFTKPCDHLFLLLIGSLPDPDRLPATAMHLESYAKRRNVCVIARCIMIITASVYWAVGCVFARNYVPWRKKRAHLSITCIVLQWHGVDRASRIHSKSILFRRVQLLPLFEMVFQHSRRICTEFWLTGAPAQELVMPKIDHWRRPVESWSSRSFNYRFHDECRISGALCIIRSVGIYIFLRSPCSRQNQSCE